MTRREFGAFTAQLAAVRKSGLRAGCQTNAWRINPTDAATFLGVVAKIRGYGYDGFETSFRNVETITQKFDGITLLGVHIFLTQYDPETFIAPAALIEKVARQAAELRAERVILSGVPAGINVVRKAQALNGAAKICRDLGLGLAYHNHAPELLEMTAMLDATTAGVQLIFDVGHAAIAGVPFTVFFLRHRARIAGLHLRDLNGARVQVPLGEGALDFANLAAAIEKTKWEGWMINEEERLNDEKPGDGAVGPARRKLKELFGV